MTTATIESLAQEAASCFETAKRDDDSTYVRLKDERPAWVYNLVYVAHSDMLPDDWRYKTIHSALEHIAEGGDVDDAGEFADSNCDVYTSDQLAWLASHLSRVSYCDEAASEFGYDPEKGITGLIAMGQYLEGSEVYNSVVQSLRAVADES